MGTPVSPFWGNLFFAACIIVGQTGTLVSLPLFSDVVHNGGGSAYFVVWFGSLSFAVVWGLVTLCMWCTKQIGQSELQTLSIAGQRCLLQLGLADALGGMMIVFASPSSRTPPYLQAILGNFTIPMTIIARKWILNKFPSLTGMASASLVLIGLFISLIPTISDWDGPDVQTLHGIFWPCWFMAGFIPTAIMSVLEERALQHDQEQVNALWILFWLNMWQLIFVSGLFWLDFVPAYGMSGGLVDCMKHMHDGLLCVIPGDRCGQDGFKWAVVFCLCYMLNDAASAMLLRYSEGATWQVIVSTLVSPLGVFWWTLFKEKPTLHWQPEWANTTTFALLGILLMLPGIFMYKWKGSTEPHALEKTLL